MSSSLMSCLSSADLHWHHHVVTHYLVMNHCLEALTSSIGIDIQVAGLSKTIVAPDFNPLIYR